MDTTLPDVYQVATGDINIVLHAADEAHALLFPPSYSEVTWGAAMLMRANVNLPLQQKAEKAVKAVLFSEERDRRMRTKRLQNYSVPVDTPQVPL